MAGVERPNHGNVQVRLGVKKRASAGEAANVSFWPRPDIARTHGGYSACRRALPDLAIYLATPIVDCERVTGGGFHLPVSASDFGA